MNIAIIGHGFVGEAVDSSFENMSGINTIIVDPKDPTNATLEEAVATAQIFFICLPTPQQESGHCDANLVASTVLKINELVVSTSPLIIIKSTAPPNVLHFLETNTIVPLVYSPEFLTQANSTTDYLNPKMQILGGFPTATHRAEHIIINRSRCQPCPIYHTDIKTASLIKYTINSYLATKVSFMNELYQLHMLAGADSTFEEFAKILSTDPRIGASHLQVPGPDGEFGFGGACFPKDTRAFLKYAENLGFDLSVLDAAVKVNNKIRK